jgi:hypothetical protein
LSRKDIDAIVAHLAAGDPEVKEAIPAHQIGMQDYLPARSAAESRTREQWQAVHSDITRFTRDIHNKQGKAKVELDNYVNENIPFAQRLDARLGLDKNPRWSAFKSQVMENCRDERGNCAALNHFYTILQGCDTINPNKPELVQTVINLAKYNNKFGAIDGLMKQFAKVMIQGGYQTEHVAQNLEMLLNTEVAVRNEPKQKESYDMEYAVHHNIIAQGSFQFLSAGGKLK